MAIRRFVVVAVMATVLFSAAPAGASPAGHYRRPHARHHLTTREILERTQRILRELEAALSNPVTVAVPLEWTPPPECGPLYWRSHRNGPGKCGWHNVGSLIGRVFKTHAHRALCTARRESGMRPWAKNPHSTASGLFQLVALHWRGRFNPFNPVANTLFALQLSRGGTD